MKFRKKPVVIEAVQWTGDNAKEIRDFLQLTDVARWYDGTLVFRIETLEGQMTASKGDWIIKGVKGEFYPCKPDIFEATYEPAEAESQRAKSESSKTP
jgi:hypothetical protein